MASFEAMYYTKGKSEGDLMSFIYVGFPRFLAV